jgi:hypothetical protein
VGGLSTDSIAPDRITGTLADVLADRRHLAYHIPQPTYNSFGPDGILGRGRDTLLERTGVDALKVLRPLRPMELRVGFVDRARSNSGRIGLGSPGHV